MMLGGMSEYNRQYDDEKICLHLTDRNRSSKCAVRSWHFCRADDSEINGQIFSRIFLVQFPHTQRRIHDVT